MGYAVQECSSFRARLLSRIAGRLDVSTGVHLRVLLGQLVVCAYTAWPLVVCAWRTEISVTPSSWQSQQSEKERSFVCELSAAYLFY